MRTHDEFPAMKLGGPKDLRQLGTLLDRFGAVAVIMGPPPVRRRSQARYADLCQLLHHYARDHDARIASPPIDQHERFLRRPTGRFLVSRETQEPPHATGVREPRRPSPTPKSGRMTVKRFPLEDD